MSKNVTPKRSNMSQNSKMSQNTNMSQSSKTAQNSQKALNSKVSQNSKISQNSKSKSGLPRQASSQKAMSKAQKSKSKQETDKSKEEKSESDEKPCCVAVVCDPSPEGKAYAEKKARMRANMPDQPTFEPWLRSYKDHLKAVEQVKPLIDCSEPMVARDNYCLMKKYNLQGEEFIKLERENAIIARRIAHIFVDGSQIDDRHDPNVPSVHRMDNRHEKERERRETRLMQENVKLFEIIDNVKPVINRQEQLDWYNKMEKLMDLRSAWPLHFKPPPCPAAYKNMIGTNAKNPKQYAYLQVEMEDTIVQNLTCELFGNLCPFTARNFIKLCTFKKEECECRTYRCKTIDKLVSIARKDGEYERAYWQCAGGVDAFPELIPHLMKEGSKVKHSKEGYLTRPRGLESGEFYITAGPAPYLDDLCYVFGKIVGPGIGFLKQVGEQNIDTQGNPKKPIHITDTGVVESPDKVPPAMLMRDFIFRVQDDIQPILEKDLDKLEEEEDMEPLEDMDEDDNY